MQTLKNPVAHVTSGDVGHLFQVTVRPVQRTVSSTSPNVEWVSLPVVECSKLMRLETVSEHSRSRLAAREPNPHGGLGELLNMFPDDTIILYEFCSTSDKFEMLYVRELCEVNEHRAVHQIDLDLKRSEKYTVVKCGRKIVYTTTGEQLFCNHKNSKVCTVEIVHLTDTQETSKKRVKLTEE